MSRFEVSSRFQVFVPGVGVFLVLLGALMTALGVTWMRGGEAAAVPVASALSVTKTNGTQVGQVVEWSVVITNIGDFSEPAEFVDEYLAPAGSVITSFDYVGDEAAMCTSVPDVSLQCSVYLWDHSTALLTIRTTLPATQCEDITVFNDARLYGGVSGTTLVGEALVVGDLISEDLENTFVVQGDPTPCQSPTPETPTPTVCAKCSTPPPTFPPGIISTPVPTNTPVPPPPTPTSISTGSGSLTDEQRTQTAVAGAKTAAALITPLPPRTGEGSQSAAQTGVLNMSLAIGGLIVLAAGLGIIGVRARKTS